MRTAKTVATQTANAALRFPVMVADASSESSSSPASSVGVLPSPVSVVVGSVVSGPRPRVGADPLPFPGVSIPVVAVPVAEVMVVAVGGFDEDPVGSDDAPESSSTCRAKPGQC